MKKKKEKKEKSEELEEIVDERSFLERYNIAPLRMVAVLLVLFSIFSFSSLFGKAGMLGGLYFTFITSMLGLFAYLTPLACLFIAYILFLKKYSVLKNEKLYLFIFLIFAIFIILGFFHISGRVGNGTEKYLANTFGFIPTMFLLVITSLLALFRIFETDILDFLKVGHTKPQKALPEEMIALEEPEEEVDSKPGPISSMFGKLFGGSAKEEKVKVNHLEGTGLDQPEEEYEEVEVEEEAPADTDVRSAMFKAVSMEVDKPEKVKVKKLVKKVSDEQAVENKKENTERLRQVNDVYRRPPISLYTEDAGKGSAGDNKENARIIKRTLADFGISVEMDEVTVGPTVTRYALKPAQGVKIEKIINLGNNIALELGVPSVSITRIHERSLIGIEVPNKQKAKLGLSGLLASREFLDRKDKLTMSFGKDIYGEPVFADMTKMPHLLVAGTTGSGKSVLVHGIIQSLIYKNSPYDLKFILVDPKKVELALYNNLPHLYTPVIKDPKKAVQTLNWLVQEMDRRYAVLEEVGKQNIAGYHQYVMEKYKKAEGGGANKLPEKMPYIVLVIDELADFMMKYPKEMESGIVKLAQMSRAVGIHLILATQRPSTNIITGVIKGNIPSRVALRVASQVDSRVIIDQGGAEKLLGYGDLLFVNADGSDIKRIQSPNVTEEEIKDVVAYLRSEYDDLVAEELKVADGKVAGGNVSGGGGVSDAEFGEEDDKYEQAKEVVIQTGKTSVSNLQVRLGTGYARSAKLINMLEQAGVIVTTTDNSGKKVKVVAGHGNSEASPKEEESNTREDILKVPAKKQAEETDDEDEDADDKKASHADDEL
jgi:S-DNA-T family DNA segregation ATPase FtsK/SpoIIIE